MLDLFFSWNLFRKVFLHVLLTSVFGRYAVRSSSLGAAGLGGTALLSLEVDARQSFWFKAKP